MAVITDKGIEQTTTLEYKDAYEQAYTATFGSDLDLDAQTVEGQLIGINTAFATRFDEQVVGAFQQLNINAASGNQLDNITATFSIERRGATSSRATVRLFAVPGTVIPQGAQAITTNGDVFEAVQPVVFTGIIEAYSTFASVEKGEIPIDANTLNTIISPIQGWETINNPNDGIVGSLLQNDTDFRNEFFRNVNKNALAIQEAIEAQILMTDGVVDVSTTVNDSNQIITVKNIQLLPHSIAIVVEGGNEQLIGQAIYQKKALGTGTEGVDNSIQTAVIVANQVLPYYYYPVELVPVNILITIQQFVVLPDIIDQIKQNILDYFDGTFDETIPKIGISDTLYKSRLYTPINGARGFEVISLEIFLNGGSDQEVIEPNLNQRLITTNDIIGVTITS